MKLIVGLGNPGPRYQNTRHNIGFDVVDEVAHRRGLAFESSPADAVMARERGPDGQVTLVKPLTFMNLSGVAVQRVMHYYRISLGDVLVVTDDINLPLGRLRARRGGSDGGHNGLRSVLETLGTDKVARLRVGVGRGDERRDLAEHVLAGFEDAELAHMRAAVQRAADAVSVFVSDGIESVMNQFNPAEVDTSPASESRSEPNP